MKNHNLKPQNYLKEKKLVRKILNIFINKGGSAVRGISGICREQARKTAESTLFHTVKRPPSQSRKFSLRAGIQAGGLKRYFMRILVLVTPISLIALISISIFYQPSTIKAEVDNSSLSTAGKIVEISLMTGATPVNNDETVSFKAYETPSFEISVSDQGGISGFFKSSYEKIASVFDDERHKLKAEVVDATGKVIEEKDLYKVRNLANEVVEASTDNLIPGKYTLKVIDSDTDRYTEQDFTWGVLALNTNKSVYRTGDTAKFQFAVLDDFGDMVCDAQLKLAISLQSTGYGNKENTVVRKLSTESGDIKVNKEACNTKGYTLVPDYEAEFDVAEPGIYELTLTAETNNGVRSIKDSLLVIDKTNNEELKTTTQNPKTEYSAGAKDQSTNFFDIERMSATRIFPKAYYPMVISVTPSSDFKGEVYETLDREILAYYMDSSDLKERFDLDYANVETNWIAGTNQEDTKTIKWRVDWKAGETYRLAYRMRFAEESPEFYLLGPLVFKSETNSNVFVESRPASDYVFVEARQWQLAIDASSGAANPATAVEDTTVGNTSWTNYTNVFTSDENRATAVLGQGATQSYYIKATNFGIDLVGCNSITGITVRVERSMVQTGNDNIRDLNVRLVNGSGTIVGDNKADTGTNWPTTDAYVTYGSSSDNWNASLACADIDLDADFGVVFAANHVKNGGWDDTTARVDHIEVTVEYAQDTQTMSGNIKQDDESTNLPSSGGSIVLVNGTTDNTTSYSDADGTDASGNYSIASVITPSTGDTMTLWINGATADGSAAINYGSNCAGYPSCTDLNFFQNAIVVRDDNTGTITNTDLADCDNDTGTACTDTEIGFTSNTGTLTASSGREVHVYTGDTFNPGGDVDTNATGGDVHIDDSATMYFDTATNSIGLDVKVDNAATANFDADTTIAGGDITVLSGGDVASSTGTVTMGAGGTIGGGGAGSVFQLTNLTASSGTTTLGADADNTLAFTGDINVSTGATLAMNDKSANVDGGNVTTSGTGDVTCASCTAGTLNLAGDGTTNGIGGGGTVTVYNLTLDGSSDTTNAGSAVTAMNTLTVNSTNTLDMGANNLTVGNSGVTDSGTIAAAGDITQSASATTTVQSSDNSTAPTLAMGSGSGVYNLNIGSASDNLTYTFDLAGNIYVSNDFTITSGGTGIHTLTGQGYQIEVGGNWTDANSTQAVFTPGTSTVLMEATSGTPTITSGGSFFNNLSIDNGGTAITWTLQDALDVNGNLLIDTSNTLNTGTDYAVNVAGNWTNNGTFAGNASTVTPDGATGSTQQITGATTFPTLSATATGTRTLEFASSTTFTVSTGLTLTGTSCNGLLLIRASTSGTAFILANGDATETVSYADFQDTTVSTNNIDGGTNLADSGGNTNITFDGGCEGGSTNADATAYSFQRKTVYDSTNSVHWMAFYDGNEIEVKYSDDNGTTWTRDSSLSYNTNDFSIWYEKIGSIDYLFAAITSANDIVVKRATMSATPSLAWDTLAETSLDGTGASDSYSYPYISIDSADRVWVMARHLSGTDYTVKAINSANDTGTTEWGAVTWDATVDQISNNQTNSNVYGNIVPLATQDMYATFTVNTDLLGCLWDDSDSAWEDSAGATCSVTSGGAGDSEGSSSRSTGGAVKIDDAGDPGAMPGAGRQIVQLSDGTLYAIINDGGNVKAYSSSDGSSWTQQDSGTTVTADSTDPISLALDSSDNLHISYLSGANVRYRKFTTSGTPAWGSEETPHTATSVATEAVIVVDGNDIPHLAINADPASGTEIRYRNRVGGSWTRSVAVDTDATSGFISVSAVINKNNIIEISYIDSTNNYLTAAVGNTNDAASFTVQDVDTTVNDTADQRGTSIVVDKEGNTWIAYIDATTNYVTLVEHQVADVWTTWQTPITNSNVGYEPSLSIIGSTLFVFYEEDSTDQKIVYDAYDSGTADWLGETTLATPGSGVDFQDVKVRYSNFNFHEPWLMDYLYSDGTDIYWNYVDLRAVNIDDASDFGAMPGAGSQVVRASKGDLYSVLNDSGNIEVRQSSDGYVWKEQDAGNSPIADLASEVAVAIDSNDDLHLVYTDNSSPPDVYYVLFTDSTGLYGTPELVEDVAGSNVIYSLSISLDQSGVPHVAFGLAGGLDAILYENRVGADWTGGTNVETGTTYWIDITINEDNVPEIVFINPSDNDLALSLGNLNDATSFTTKDVDTDVNDTDNQRGGSISVNTLTGDTWVAYVDSDNTIALAKNTGDWDTGWSTITTKTDVGYEPSIAIAGSSDIYVFYQEDSTDQKIAYDVYDSDAASPAWSGETALQTPPAAGDYQNVKAKWSFEFNNFGANRIDYLFSDGTDVYWDYLYLRREPTNIDDASDFGVLLGARRQVVRTSTGALYAVLQDGANLEVWKSLDNGNTWSQQDSGTSIITNGSPVAAIDGGDPETIHILYREGTNPIYLYYRTFDTSSDTFAGSTDTIDTVDGVSDEYLYNFSITIDDNNKPHVVWAFLEDEAGSVYVRSVRYSNKTSTSWSSFIVLKSNTDSDQYLKTSDITINEDNIPEVSYTYQDSVQAFYRLYAEVGDTNNPTSFTEQLVDSGINTTQSVVNSIIAIDSSGNTWVAYVDENGTDDYISLAYHPDASGWTSDWEVGLTNSNVGYEPSIAIDGTDIYVFYEDDEGDIVFDKYDGSTWSGETVLEQGAALQDAKPRWSYINNYDSTGTARVQTNTYYFDTSDAGPTDPQSVWTTDANAFDGSISTSADTANPGSTSSNYLEGIGTSALSNSNGTVISVKARIHAESPSGDPLFTTANAAIYSDASELLGTASVAVNDVSVNYWSSYITLSTPSGGWDWTEASQLRVKIYATDDALLAANKVEILVQSTNTTAQTEIDYLYTALDQGGVAADDDVWYNRLILGAGTSSGSQDSIDTVPTGLSNTLSAVADNNNYDVHLIYVDDEATDQISYKRWDSTLLTWDSQPAGIATHSGNVAYPSLSTEGGSDDLIAYYVNTSDNDIYFKSCDVSAASSECGNSDDWAYSSSPVSNPWKTTTATYLTSAYLGTCESFSMWRVNGGQAAIDWDRFAQGGGGAAYLVQNDFEWFVDEASTTLTNPWPAGGGENLGENVALTQLPAVNEPLESGNKIRIQMNFEVAAGACGGDLAVNSQKFQLQYATAETCSAATDWFPVGNTSDAGIWKLYDNASIATSSADIRQISTSTSGAEGLYSEGIPTPLNPNAVTTGQFSEWDWPIENNGAAENTSYCFRMVKDDGSLNATAFDEYNSDGYPKVTTMPGTSVLLKHGKFFQNNVLRGFFWAD